MSSPYGECCFPYLGSTKRNQNKNKNKKIRKGKTEMKETIKIAVIALVVVLAWEFVGKSFIMPMFTKKA